MNTRTPHVTAELHGHLGVLTLARPEALNALSADMVHALADVLTDWTSSAEVRAVVLRGQGERGLCAGGDVRALYHHLVEGREAEAEAFFRAEYALNAQIASSTVPVVALADGITMGGGIGLAGHAQIRVVTERSLLAMPETRIGFTPDVGGSWLMSHAPGRIGEYLALTGTAVGAADAIAVGLADVHVPSDRLDALVDALRTSRSDPREVVDAHATPPAPGMLELHRDWIDHAFSRDSMPEIVAALGRRHEDEAHATARLLETLSPTGLTVTLAAIRRARTLATLQDALAQEFGLVQWFGATQPDLREGIRAQLVDKDRSPHWNPGTLDAVPATLVDEAFAFTPDRPLWKASA